MALRLPAGRLVWNRIWAKLSDFFVEVGCHRNLAVAMYAVDSLRQLAMKFLERDELANYSFQNDFLKPFVVVMRLSKAVEIRELIIRCCASPPWLPGCLAGWLAPALQSASLQLRPSCADAGHISLPACLHGPGTLYWQAVVSP